MSTASLAAVLPAVEKLRELGQDRELLRALIDRLEDQRIRSHPRVRTSLEDAPGRLRALLERGPLTSQGFRLAWTPTGKQAAGKLRGAVKVAFANARVEGEGPAIDTAIGRVCRGPTRTTAAA